MDETPFPLEQDEATIQPGQLILDTLRVEDLPALMVIEEYSFSAPWSEGTYRHEIMSNPMAFYYVIRPPMVDKASETGTATGAEARTTESPTPDALITDALTHRRTYALNTDSLNTEHPILAYGGFWLTGDEAHIVTIASHQELRGRKLGETMLLLLLQQAQTLGAIHVTLEVRPSNVAAVGLYRKWGFEEEGRRKGYYRDNREDALIYTLHDLDNPAVYLPIVLALGINAANPDLIRNS